MIVAFAQGIRPPRSTLQWLKSRTDGNHTHLQITVVERLAVVDVRQDERTGSKGQSAATLHFTRSPATARLTRARNHTRGQALSPTHGPLHTFGRTRVSENWAGGSTTRFHTAIVRRSSNAPFGDHSIRTASAEAPAQRHRRVIKPRPVVQSRWPSRTPRSAVPRPASAMRGVLTHLDSALRR